MSDELEKKGAPEEHALPPEVEESMVSVEPEEGDDSVAMAQRPKANDVFRRMMDTNFLEYASYVIGSRAIPDVDDGLKPVQRRIMWTLFEAYDNGRLTKTANIVGNCMHYHPHGDASIGDALVVLANKGGCIERMEKDKDGVESLHFINIPYFISKGGNFGHILTGSPAAAARYTECALTRLAYETMFNNDITAFVPNYDGRRKEPVQLPAKVPSLLMLGSDGIAVGMSTMILPHNFNELIDAEIAELRGEEFHLYPDFQQGGVMDVSGYEDGNGKITLRAKIDIEGRDLVIREIPATCTTASLIASIERAAEKNKIRIAANGIGDFTTDHVEIRITPARGYDPEKTRQGLFMYTDCSVSISPKLMVICDRRPVQMSVTDVLKRNVQKLLGYIRQEFELELARLAELRHAKTLAQLFFENRIYKRIEECKNEAAEYKEVMDGLAPFRDQLLRDVTKEDVDKLLALPVRRIARFDIEKNEKELREIAARVKEVKHHLAHLTDYTIGYLEEIKKKFGADFPRRTEIEKLEVIDRTSAALNNIKVFWDRKNGHIGTGIKSDDVVMCNEFDKLLCLERSGKYRIIEIPDKMFIGKLCDFRKYDAKQEFGILYTDKKTGKLYGKRSTIDKYIKGREYLMAPANSRIELFTPRPDAIYDVETEGKRGKTKTEAINLMTLPVRSPKARGFLVGANFLKATHQRYLEEAELAEFRAMEAAVEASAEDASEEVAETPAVAETAPVAENTPESAPVAEATPAPAPVPSEVTPTESAPAPAAKKSKRQPKPVEPKVEEPAAEPEAEPEPVAENTPAPEPVAEATPPPAPVPSVPLVPSVSSEVTPEEPESESAPEPEPLVLSDEPEAKVRKRAPKAPAPEPPQKKDDPEDDLGIVQPEFGF